MPIATPPLPLPIPPIREVLLSSQRPPQVARLARAYSQSPSPPPRERRQTSPRYRVGKRRLANAALRPPVGASTLELARGRRARVHAELLEDPRYVPVDGAHAQEQLVRDLAVRLARGDELDDLELAARQPGERRIVNSLSSRATHDTAELAKLAGGLVAVAKRAAGGELLVGELELPDRPLLFARHGQRPAGENAAASRLDDRARLVGCPDRRERPCRRLSGFTALERDERLGSQSLSERDSESEPSCELGRAPGKLGRPIRALEH